MKRILRSLLLATLPFGGRDAEWIELRSSHMAIGVIGGTGLNRPFEVCLRRSNASR